MSEAVWIELIRLLPSLLWIAFGFAALIFARRILTKQAHRMTKVDTPFVSIELAQEAIEEAYKNVRSTPEQEPVPETPVVPAFPQSQTLGSPWPGSGSGDTGNGDAFGGSQGGGATFGGSGNGPDPFGGPPPADEDAEADDEMPALPTQQGSPTSPATGAPPLPDRPTYPYPTEPDESDFSPQLQPPWESNANRDRARGLKAATRLANSADLLQGGAILWVDDHPEWNQALVRLFRTAGIRVDTVGSTNAAMRAMRSDNYDVVITDMRREGEASADTAGLDLLDTMVQTGVPTPAVFYSSHQDARASHPRAAGSTNSPEALVDFVVDLVGHRRARGFRNEFNGPTQGWFNR